MNWVETYIESSLIMSISISISISTLSKKNQTPLLLHHPFLVQVLKQCRYLQHPVPYVSPAAHVRRRPLPIPPASPRQWFLPDLGRELVGEMDPEEGEGAEREVEVEVGLDRALGRQLRHIVPRVLVPLFPSEGAGWEGLEWQLG
jgi:hypothetical protein